MGDVPQASSEIKGHSPRSQTAGESEKAAARRVPEGSGKWHGLRCTARLVLQTHAETASEPHGHRAHLPPAPRPLRTRGNAAAPVFQGSDGSLRPGVLLLQLGVVLRAATLARSLRVRRQRPRNLFCGERLEVGHHLDQFPGNRVTRVAGAGTVGPSLGESRGGDCCWARRSRPANAALKCGQKPTSKGERRQERGQCEPRL